METLGEYLKSLRGKESLRDASKRIGISHTYLDTVEKGFDKRSGKPINPTPETLKLIAKAYNCDYEELMVRAGYLENGNSLPELTSKDEKDLVNDLQNILDGLEGGYAAYDGKTPEEIEDFELFKASLETSLRLAKRVAKDKFTPKKHKK